LVQRRERVAARAGDPLERCRICSDLLERDGLDVLVEFLSLAGAADGSPALFVAEMDFSHTTH